MHRLHASTLVALVLLVRNVEADAHALGASRAAESTRRWAT